MCFQRASAYVVVGIDHVKHKSATRTNSHTQPDWSSCCSTSCVAMSAPLRSWVVHDFYCGLGGWSCGVAAHLRSIGASDAEFHGYEMDAELLRQWERNVRWSVEF